MNHRKTVAAAVLLSMSVLLPGALAQAPSSAAIKLDEHGRRVPFPIAAPVANYAPDLIPADIAPTPGTANDPNKKVEVFGQPRMAKGHPNTLWDQEDIARYKELLKTDKSLQDMLKTLTAKADEEIKQPISVPGTHKDADGKWMTPEDFPASEPPNKKINPNSVFNARVFDDCAVAYALSGDEKYGEYAKKIILAYAANYPKWGRPARSKYRYAYDGRLTSQFLNDGMFLATMAFGYDLIYDLPSFTAEDHKNIHDNFFLPVITPFFVQGRPGVDYLSTRDNRSCICAAAVVMAGYATDDPELVNFGLHGHAGTTLKPVATEAVPVDPKDFGGDLNDKTPGGLLTVHFGEDCLLPDGLWVEGSPAYTLSIAGCGLFDTAEMLWRHGVDMYSFRNGALKRLLDSGVLLANPDPKYSVPALRDSGAFGLLTPMAWLNGQIGSLYYCGYKRYHVPSYLPIVRNAAEHLTLTVHSGPPLIKDNLPDTVVNQPPVQNVNFYSTGYGILRFKDQDGKRISSLLLQYGQVGEWSGHDHPSELGIDLYCWGDELSPFPGVIFPYNNPNDPKWYWTTLGNCTMEVDQDDQLYADNRFHKYLGAPKPTTPQLIYAPGATFGMERAYSSSVYPGTTLDRSLFMTPDYVAEVFGGFSSVQRIYDLAWHFRGKITTALPVEDWKFPEPAPNGYNSLGNVKRAQTEKPWSADIAFQGKTIRFVAAGNDPTQVILGDAELIRVKEHPSIVIERRDKINSTVFGNAVDISGDKDPYVKSLTQEGSLDAGYGLLKIETAKGTDLCFTAYRPGSYKAGDLETDAQQAMVMMDGNSVRAMYLAGGKSLKVGDAILERSEPGLASVEKLSNGDYVVSNPSPTDATITVTLPGVPQAGPFKQLVKAGSTVNLSAKEK